MKKRELSAFMAESMILDYLQDRLDPLRRQDFEDYRKKNSSLEKEIEKIQAALSYIQKLQKAPVPEVSLESPAGFFSWVLDLIQYETWSPSARLASEVALVATALISVALIMPWHQLLSLRMTSSQSIVISEVVKTENVKEDKGQKDQVQDSNLAFPDEGIVNSTTDKPETQTVAKAVVSTTTTTLAKSTVAQGANTKPTVTTTTLPAKVASEATEKRQGYLYRGKVKITNVPAVNTRLVADLQALGAQKAGQVELGWRKGSGSYFHFTVPESRLKDVESAFNLYGKIVLSKERHERIMPEGIARIIIDVEEAGSKGL